MLSIANWGEAHRELSRAQSDRAGPLRNDNAPYLIGIMNLLQMPNIEEVYLEKAAQVGASEASRTFMGYCADRDPDPMLFVMPDEASGREIIKRRIIPLFDETPVLRRLHTGIKRDMKMSSLQLSNGFHLRLGYSGSPTSLKSHPCRYVVLDEPDDYQLFSGRNADPMSMARKRTRTYGRRRKIFALGTPTTAEGVIHQLVENAPIKLAYFVPCPHCGAYQVLTFDRLRWHKPEGEHGQEQLAAWVKQNRAVVFECGECKKESTDQQKTLMVRHGAWATAAVGPRLKWSEDDKHVICPSGQRVQGGDVCTDEWPPGERVGVKLGGLVCLWETLHEIAAEFIRAKGSIAKLIDFYNQTLGEPFQAQITRTAATIYHEKSKRGTAPGIVPKWASVLIATADVQLNRFYYVIRAWGQGFRSQRVAHGEVFSFDELRDLCLSAAYPIEGGGSMSIRGLGIDSGYRTQDVYGFALKDMGRIKVLKGGPPSAQPFRNSKQSYVDPLRKSVQNRIQVYLTLIDSTHFKDLLTSKVNESTDSVDTTTGEVFQGQESWTLNSDNDEDYNRQMASEHKVLVRKGKAVPTEEWQLMPGCSDNHYWDCEVYQVAMAHIVRVDLLRPARPRVSNVESTGTRAPIRRSY